MQPGATGEPPPRAEPPSTLNLPPSNAAGNASGQLADVLADLRSWATDPQNSRLAQLRDSGFMEQPTGLSGGLGILENQSGPSPLTLALDVHGESMASRSMQ